MLRIFLVFAILLLTSCGATRTEDYIRSMQTATAERATIQAVFSQTPVPTPMNIFYLNTEVYRIVDNEYGVVCYVYAPNRSGVGSMQCIKTENLGR